MDPVPIGKLIEGEEHRDAIHIAVAPVVAARTLFPSQRIGFVGDDMMMVAETDSNIGIVDPFLNHPVQKGDRFWMFLNPNTITSLRHDWMHPAFKTAPELAEIPPFADKMASEKWLREFAESNNVTYGCVRDAAREFLETGERYIQRGSESLRDSMYGGVSEQFWRHYSVVTGKEVTFGDDGDNPFCCSC